MKKHIATLTVEIYETDKNNKIIMEYNPLCLQDIVSKIIKNKESNPINDLYNSFSEKKKMELFKKRYTELENYFGRDGSDWFEKFNS